ncbi:hypothetical protein Tco_0967035 [Tanacetum coccineum]
MMEEYNYQISFRDDPLTIIKISYVVNSKKEATMNITRGDNPLNLIVHPNFRLKTLGFSEWLKVHALTSKKSRTSNNLLLQSLRAKFQWVINQAKRLGLPLLPELATFRLTTEDKKRKRTEIMKERESEFHITSIVQLIRLLKHINQDSLEAREMYNIIEMEIESRDDVNKAREIIRTNSYGMGIDLRSDKGPLSIGLRGIKDQLSAKHQLAVKGLSECKASESNIRRI